MRPSTRRDLLRGVCGAALIAATAGAIRDIGAHRSHVTLTRLLSNSATQRWEVIHAIHYHDAATALRQLSRSERLDPTTPKGQARLMLEVERRILWSTSAGAMALTAVGAELAGDSVLLYQECPPPPRGSSVLIESRLLHMELRGQINRFSIETLSPPLLLSTDATSPRVQFEA